jgi:CHAD domain-containing protein
MMAEKLDESICGFGAAIMLEQLTAINAEIRGVQAAADIECIHRMRVASRRLRAAQEYFDICLPGRTAGKFEKAIRSITGSLGKARDLDIQIDSFRKFQILADQSAYQPGFKRLLLRLYQRRILAQQEVIASVTEINTNPVIIRVEDLLNKFPPQENHKPFSLSLRILAHNAILDKLKEFLSYAPFVHLPEKKVELHAMRIAAKKLRYTLEIFAPIFPGELKNWIKVTRQFQDQLGEIHDCDVWIESLPYFLETERVFTIDYFGHTRSYNRIVPGIMVYHENRQSTRQRIYQEFVLSWDSMQKKRIWGHLSDHLDQNFPVEKTRTLHIERIAKDLEENDENSIDQ